MKKVLTLCLMALSCVAFSQKKIDLSAIWIAPTGPTLYTSTTSISGISTTQGTASTPFTFTVSGDNLTAQAVITAPSWLEISLSSSSGYTGSINAPQSSGNITGEPLTFYGRIKSSETAGAKSGNITATSAGAATINISVSGTVNAASTPNITLSTSTVTLPTSTAGTDGASTTFTVSGTNLTGNISIASSNANVALSTNNSTFTSPVTVTPSSGTVSAVTIYLKTLASATAPSVSATITASSAGATNRTLTASGTVNAGGGGGADTTYSDTTQYNINYATQSIAGWTDITPANTAPHTAVKTATVSGRTLSTNASSAWLGVPATTSDTNGEDASDGGGFAHNATAQRSYAFNYNNTYNGSTSDANLKVSGLTSGDWYVVEVLPSRESSNLPIPGDPRYGKYILIHQDGQTEYTTFSNGATINATGNTSKVVKMYGKANSSGELFVWGGGTTNADDQTRYAFFNTVRIYKMTITP